MLLKTQFLVRAIATWGGSFNFLLQMSEDTGSLYLHMTWLKLPIRLSVLQGRWWGRQTCGTPYFCLRAHTTDTDFQNPKSNSLCIGSFFTRLITLWSERFRSSSRKIFTFHFTPLNQWFTWFNSVDRPLIVDWSSPPIIDSSSIFLSLLSWRWIKLKSI